MKKFVSIVLAVLMTVGLAACGNDISTSDSDKTTTTSAVVTEKNDSISQTTTSKNEEETPAENDPDLLTVKINGVDITLGVDMDIDEFVDKTGLTVEKLNPTFYSVTDGNSTFEINIIEGKIEMLIVKAAGTDEEFSVDTSKTEIIFPGGATLDTPRSEIQTIYPFKNNGSLTSGNSGGETESDMWILKLEDYDYSGLMFIYENGSAEKPCQIGFMLQ
jgi:hypothetical protein